MYLTISASVDAHGGLRTQVAVTGALDLATTPVLVDSGVRELSSGADLMLDLSAVDFMDASGVGGLVTLAVAAEHDGRTFELTATSARVSRVLKLTGLAGRWSPRHIPSASESAEL